MTTETKHMPSERETFARWLVAWAYKINNRGPVDWDNSHHDFQKRWLNHADEILNEVNTLTAASQSRAPDQEITVRDGKWAQKKVSCRQLAEWISEQAISDRDGLIQRVAEAIEEDRKITRARVPDQSERVRGLEAENETLARLVEHQKSVIDFYATGAAEAALVEARKVIDNLLAAPVACTTDDEVFDNAARRKQAADWRNRNLESSNGK